MILPRKVFASAIVLLSSAVPVFGQVGGEKINPPKVEQTAFPAPPSILDKETRPIDLGSALQLAGVQNPQILLARERVVEAAALRQLAAAQFLPSINVGTNVNHHQGTLQQSTGNMLQVNRDAMYLGLGAAAVGAGTVNIPGVVWSGNVSATLYRALATRQVVRQRQFANDAVRNQMLLQVAQAYVELLRAEGRRAIADKNRTDALDVAQLTASYAKVGQGRQADADRAATELEQRNNDVLQAENDLLSASARLSQLLSLNPSDRLRPTDGWVIPQPLVPEPIPLPELVTIAITQRPELQERQAAIRAALLEMQNAKMLPFSPNVILGYSAGGFGGGSNLVADATPPQSRFSNLQNRQDLDVIVYWSIKNLGVGNLASVRLAQSNVRQNEIQNVEVFDRIRAEVVLAYARTHSRFAQIESSERAVQSSEKAFAQDFVRTKNREGLPIEVLDSMRLLGRSRYTYLDAIVEYNRAHFELYVALGQPPADALARPIPSKLAPPPTAPK